MGAIHLAKNPATTPNSKHIDIRHHFIRERVANGEFKIVYVSEEQHVFFIAMRVQHSYNSLTNG